MKVLNNNVNIDYPPLKFAHNYDYLLKILIDISKFLCYNFIELSKYLFF